MIQFFKHTIAATLGVLIATVILTVAGIAIVAGMVAADSSDTLVLEEKSVLVVNLSGEIVEHAEDNPLGMLLGQDNLQQGLDDIVGAIDKAADTPEIAAIYIEGGITSTDYASLQEIRNAIIRAKAKGKPVVSYAREYSQGAYYVCSAADKVWINPEGVLDLHGIAAKTVYYKDLLEKFGIRMKVVKVGKFKSATEQYTEERMSDENRLQVTRYTNNIWNEVVKGISTGRKISAADVNRCADSLATLQPTEWLLSHRLVDKTLYSEDVKRELKRLIGISDDKEIERVGCAALNRSGYGYKPAEKKVAVYYCEGSIVRTEEAGAIMGDAGIVSKNVIKDLERIQKDSAIAAVVIRINSGGGDAFASEEIWHAVKSLRERKPVVVSMGGAAASGAYYLSCAATHIVAQSTTLTGSIGIFGVFPDISGLTQDKLGIKYDRVKTNAHADFDILQTARPFNAEEEEMLQLYINRGYELFCKRVAEGRAMDVDSVKAIAEGRVWTGRDAQRTGLVDEIGGIDVAIKKAAAMANAKEYETVTFPEPVDWAEQLISATGGGGGTLDEKLRHTLGIMYEPMMLIRSIEKQSPVQARSHIVISM